jgi:phenylpropionate dioxygenase-like ring-hydroxylating dioxygenase large terminal subunit
MQAQRTLPQQRLDIDYHELVRDDRVHSRLYTDPLIFEDELEKIFYGGWVYVGHASEVPEPGDYCLKWIGRQSLILCRDEDGQLHLFMNRCRHRGNTVCQWERGNANYFRCAYHGWTYRNTGELVGVPYRDRYPSLELRELGLAAVPFVGSYRGFIFASLRDPGQPLEDYLGPAVLREIDNFCDLSPLGQIEVRAGVQKSSYRGNWKMQAENVVDGYHVAFVHQSFFDLHKVRHPSESNPVNSLLNATSYDLGNGHAKLLPVSILSGLRHEPWFADYVRSLETAYGQERARELVERGETHMLVFPNMAILQSQIRVIYPRAVDHTEVHYYVVRWKGMPQPMTERLLRRHEEFFGPAGFGSPDDVEMFERSQIGLAAAVEPWLILTRGQGAERRDEQGVLVGRYDDEVTQRAFWRRYREVMSG